MSFLRLAVLKGWRPMWRLGVSVFGLTVIGGWVVVKNANPLWLLAALLAVLLIGAYFAYVDAEERAQRNEHKAARTDLLEKQLQLKAKELAVSQAHYKVFDQWFRERQDRRV